MNYTELQRLAVLAILGMALVIVRIWKQIANDR